MKLIFFFGRVLILRKAYRGLLQCRIYVVLEVGCGSGEIDTFL